MRMKHDHSLASRLHWEDDPGTLRPAITKHDHSMLQPQTTSWTTTDGGEKFMVENLRLLFQDVNTVNIDRFGSLQDWIHEANNEGY